MRNGSDFNSTSFLNSEHLKYLFFSSEGRINRQRIWLGALLLALAITVVVIISLILSLIGSFLTMIGIGIYVVAYVISTIASILMLIKRAHDRNHTGWYILLTMIPIIGIIWSIELYFFRGTDGSNQYGADPRN